MNKTNFVLTSDEETKNKLQSLGFTLIGKDGNLWRFINDGKQVFSDDKKIIYTNKLMV